MASANSRSAILALGQCNHKLILFAREKVAPQTLFLADDKIGVVAVACPGEGCWFFEADSFLPKNKFAAFEHEPEQCIAERGRSSGNEQRGQAVISAHQLWDCARGNQTGNGSPNGDFIGNNKMLEVDKGGGDTSAMKTQ